MAQQRPKIQAPHVRITSHLTHQEKAKISQFPGVVGDLVAHHAIPYVQRLLPDVQMQWAWQPAPTVLWEAVSAAHKYLGYVRPGFLDEYATSYQRDAISFGCSRTGALFHHPTGSGKTYEFVLWALSSQFSAVQPGFGSRNMLPVVVITKTSTADQIIREGFHQYTHLRAFEWKARSNRRKRDEFADIYDYQKWCQDNKQAPIVVVGWDNIASALTDLMLLQPGSLVTDESHTSRTHQRWERVPLPAPSPNDHLPGVNLEPGSRHFIIRDIKERGGFVVDSDTGGHIGIVPKDNQAFAWYMLSHRWAARRLCVTATPHPNYPRNWWVQLDNIEPGAWNGKYTVPHMQQTLHNFWAWAYRYAGAVHNGWGWEAKGRGNVDEFTHRLSRVVHKVEYSAAHRELPAKRRNLRRVPVSEQTKESGGWKRLMASAKARGKSAEREVGLMMACSRKRNAVISDTVSYVSEGRNVCIMTGRRKDVEDLAKTLTSRLKKLPAAPPVFAFHGGSKQGLQDGVAAYKASTDGAVFIGTVDLIGTSLNGLQCTDYGLVAMLPVEIGSAEQMEGRWCRKGQDRPVTIVYYWAENTEDEVVYDSFLTKLPLQAGVGESGSLDGLFDTLADTADPNAATSYVDALKADDGIMDEIDDLIGGMLG